MNARAGAAEAGELGSSGAVRPAVIAVVADPFPVPPDAGTPRPFHLLRGLARGTRLGLLAAHAAAPGVFERMLARPALDGLFAETRARTRTPGGALAALRTLLAGDPSFEHRRRDPSALATVHADARALARRLAPAVFYCWGVAALQWVPRALWRSCAWDLVDAPSMALERRIRGDASLSRAERMRLRLELPLLRAYERRTLDRVGVAIANSSVDVAYLRERHPDAPLERVIDGCDTAYFDPRPFRGAPEAEELTFVGNMLYPPNADAARVLATEILPRVQRRRPAARAVLIGPDSRGAIADLAGRPGVEVTGFVEDVRPYLARAGVVVSPLRFGAGMKNKLQAGLAMEKAMVVSSVTCEGFDDLLPGTHACVADDPDGFAARVVELLEDPARRRALGTAGAELIRSSYSWDAADAALWRALARCRAAER